MLLSLFSGLAMAQGATKTDTGINYNNVEIGYDTFVLNDYDYTWTGYGLGGNFLKTENKIIIINFSFRF